MLMRSSILQAVLKMLSEIGTVQNIPEFIEGVKTRWLLLYYFLLLSSSYFSLSLLLIFSMITSLLVCSLQEKKALRFWTPSVQKLWSQSKSLEKTGRGSVFHCWPGSSYWGVYRFHSLSACLSVMSSLNLVCLSWQGCTCIFAKKFQKLCIVCILHLPKHVHTYNSGSSKMRILSHYKSTATSFIWSIRWQLPWRRLHYLMNIS